MENGDEISNGGSSRKDIVYESKKKKRHRWDSSSDSESSDDLMFPRRKVLAFDSSKNMSSEGGSGRGIKRSWIDDSERKEVLVEEEEEEEIEVEEVDDEEEVEEEEEKKEEEEVVEKIPKKELSGSLVTRTLRSSVSKSLKVSEKPIENAGVSSNESIRYKGKNGVLKAMIKNKKKIEDSEKSSVIKGAEDSTRRVTRSAGTSKAPLSPPVYTEKKINGKLGLPIKKGKAKEKEKVKAQKIKSRIEKEESDSRLETIEISKQVDSKDMTGCSMKGKRGYTGDRTVTSKSVISAIEAKKGKNGAATEKQQIREQIKKMIFDAGWKVEYRQRQNKDYQDAIYIDLQGRGHWSITKAYYVHQEQCEINGSPFTPLPEEVLDSLTRITKKRMEREGKLNPTTDGEIVKEKRVKNKHVLKEKATHKQGKIKKPSSALVQGRRPKKQKGCALLVRSSNKGVNSDEDDFIPYSGKRTILSWLIDMGIVTQSEKVKYMNKRRTRALLEGWITRDGIHCCCCSTILPISMFEIHAGSKLCQPFENIFVDSGVSLFQCQVDAWNKQEDSDRSGFCLIDVNGDDPNDDTCGICGDGGDLICCDGCPSTFHQSCLSIESLPTGDWHCLNCSCKLCGLAAGSTTDQLEDTNIQLLTCSLCEEKYHRLCCLERDASVKSKDSSSSFCGIKCREIFKDLQKLLGVKHELEAGFSWSLIRRSDLDTNASIHELPRKAEHNAKLAVALNVLDECFVPIVDQRTNIHLIRNVLYSCGSNFNRLNYSGFYTAILERGDEIVSAATIRIHGSNFAEMPFIGTRHIYRRQGMFRRLLYAIESALASVNVERLIIPAISDLLDTWTSVFGFKPLEVSEKKELKSVNMLVFPGTGLLQKLLQEQKLPQNDSVEKAIEPKIDNNSTSNVIDNSDTTSVVERDICASDKGVTGHVNELDNVDVNGKEDPGASEILLCDTPDASNELDAAHVPDSHPSGTESAPDAEFLNSGTHHQDKSEMENGNISPFPVRPERQSSTEETADNNHVVNVENAELVPDPHSSTETSVKDKTNTATEYPNTVNGCDYKSIGGNAVQSNSNTDLYMNEVKC